MTIIKQNKKRVALFMTVLLIGMVVFLSGFVWNAKTITVVVDGQKHVLQTHQASIHGVIQEAGVMLKNGDVLRLDTKTLTNGTTITIVRAFPVTVTVDGKVRKVLTVGETAQDVANQIGYKLPKYAVVGSPEAKMQTGSTLAIEPVTSKVGQVITRDIPVKTITQSDPQMMKGE